MHFESHADVYDQARPPYPAALWSAIRDLGLMEAGRTAVDLGAGTGQATGPLLAAGVGVTAVEPGPRLAARLKAVLPAARVVEGRAETVDLPDGGFDFVVAATSIHWMDLDVVLPRIHRWLRPDGMLLVWRNVFGDPTAATPFRDRIAQIVAARRAPARSDIAEEVDAASSALTRSGLFRVEATHRYRWSLEFDEAQVHRLFTTFSDWSPEEVGLAASAVADLGGHVTEHYTSWLVVTRRQDSASS